MGIHTPSLQGTYIPNPDRSIGASIPVGYQQYSNAEADARQAIALEQQRSHLADTEKALVEKAMSSGHIHDSPWDLVIWLQQLTKQEIKSPTATSTTERSIRDMVSPTSNVPPLDYTKLTRADGDTRDELPPPKKSGNSFKRRTVRVYHMDLHTYFMPFPEGQ